MDVKELDFCATASVIWLAKDNKPISGSFNTDGSVCHGDPRPNPEGWHNLKDAIMSIRDKFFFEENQSKLPYIMTEGEILDIEEIREAYRYLLSQQNI